MKVVFVSYNNQSAFDSPHLWIEKIKTFAALMEELGRYCDVHYVKQINYDGSLSKNGIQYHFLRSTSEKSHFPVRINRLVKQLDPDIVIVSGIRSPLLVMQLRRKMGKKVKIIGRHHADHPPTGFRKFLQQQVDKCFSAYLFTSTGNAADWISSGIISNSEKIRELTEASTDLSRMDKKESLRLTGIKEGLNFLWVGRLNANKDPFTILNGFENFLATEPAAKLYMIFHEKDMIAEVEERIERSSLLKNSVILKGMVSHNELPAWYSAADFYISGSLSEGGSYALLEAMACGCIPIVTAIPAALKMTGDGKYGIVFQPGNADELGAKLKQLPGMNREEMSRSVMEHFRKELSNETIAKKLYGYCLELKPE
jgi:glycosyltransferase involved in cell wall biosynthesis